MVTALQPFLPWMAGVDGRRTYALVVVNNLELRGSGGVASSLAMITVERGVISDVRTFDISSLDRTLPGEVIAPAELAGFTGQSTWHMTDAFWSPHMPDAAKQFNFFLEKSLRSKVDGVMVMDLYALRDLIGLVGNVQLPELDEDITPKNLFERVEFHSEAKLVESGQKEYLTTLLSKTLSKLVAANTPDAGTNAFGFIGTQLSRSHMALSVSHDGLASTLSGLGWTGEVVTPSCPAQLEAATCVVSTVMQVEENVGSNRANYDIERRTDHNLLVTPDGIRHERIIQLKNTSSSTAWPRGTYRAFLRLYVPSGSRLERLEIDGTQVESQSLYEGDESGKHYFGVLVEVPIQEARVVKVLYQENRALKAPFSLSFFDQKQLGTGADSLRTTVYYAPEFHLASVAPKPVISQEKLIFSSTREKHSIIGVTFR